MNKTLAGETWDHRVMESKYRGVLKYFTIREVFYDPDDKPYLYTADACKPQGCTILELRKELKMMLKAAYAPVLSRNDFKRRKK